MIDTMTGDMTKELAEWLKRQRQKRDLCATDVAEAAGISLDALLGYEGGYPIPLFQMTQLFRAYQIRPDIALAEMLRLEEKFEHQRT